MMIIEKINNWSMGIALILLTTFTFFLHFSVKLFNSYLSKWRLQKGETKEKFPWKTTDDELDVVKEKVFSLFIYSFQI